VVEPRVELIPKHRSYKLGKEAVALSAEAGLVLDDWEAHCLRHALAQRNKRWIAPEVAIVVPRQNGKGAIIEARELAGLFLLRESLIIHSSHQFDTSLEAFFRLEALIDDTPRLKKQVARVTRSHGEEGITLRNGSRIRFRTRTKGGGRGFSCDCLILDEAMFLPEFSYGALLPTLSARPNPQVWYTGSAVDQLVHDHGVVLSRIREHAISGSERLAYFEWSLDRDNPDVVDDALASDEAAWALANPALGIRIAPEQVALERRSLDPRTFAVERLGVGDWPPTSTTSLVDMERWDTLADLRSKIEGDVVFAFDVRPDRSASAIAAAGKRSDGRTHIEIVDRRRSTRWVIDRLAELRQRHGSARVVCDAASPAASLLPELEDGVIEVLTISGRELADACGMFHDAIEAGTLRHLNTPELLAALRGASKRSLGDAWAWSRKNSAVDICPLVAATMAHWAVNARKPDPPLLPLVGSV
jgi:hypothetical protein